jgi:hypothetical protein
MINVLAYELWSTEWSAEDLKGNDRHQPLRSVSDVAARTDKRIGLSPWKM